MYAYEGIGIVIPVMEITEDQEKFPKILFLVITVTFLIYVTFGEFCYIIYGSKLVLPLITSNLPKENVIVAIVKVVFCVNLIFSYPLVIYPAF